MGNVPLSLPKEPSKTKHKELTPSRSTLFAEYSPNQNPTTSVPPTTQPARKSSSDFLDSDAESYQNSQGVGTPPQNNIIDPPINYPDNLDDNFRLNYVNFTQQIQDDDIFWENLGDNVRRDWKQVKVTNRILEDALRQYLQAIQKYAHQIQFQRRNIPEEDIDDPNDIYDEPEVE